MKVLVIDNYDSFVYNLVQLLGKLGAEPSVFRNDAISLEDVLRMEPDAVIISPGPGNPSERKRFGVCADILLNVSPFTPTLGVCLGHQGIVHVFGGSIVKATRIMHGKTSEIRHDGRTIFRGVGNPLWATRYHSLAAGAIPDELEVSAKALDDGEVMGVRHIKYPIEGVQFHPESILTREGEKIGHNFLRMAQR